MWSITMTALDRFFEQHPDSSHADRYIEPGYDQPEKGILLCNWNNVDTELVDELEAEGYELEYDDEWAVDNGGAFRTQPSSYHWQPSYMLTDGGEFITIEDDPSEWIAERTLTDWNQPMKALPDHISAEDLSSAGFMLWEEEFENGHHPGQTDNPEDIAKHLFEELEASEVVFQITEQSQFYIKYEAWYKP
jgi:hypothetical protein